ncbi:gamma-glutamylcyclotransferase-like [Amyelois transitella]|uniref:gamma-glutamylcyclotransferase-like n=1 Tax=Amyelois transitella TaxID=680683 RepID=UPI00298F5FEF|nr:gamma-glutamylcyclotransferase-like [Amyelois transitella]XP_013197116.2 gamma-glutamylcyclotransferase-like [Amyelois transitella]
MISNIKDTFLYFAYGSNLFKKRIHINNPSAVFIGVGKLEDYQLDFIKYSDNWRGSSATIVPVEGSQVWGAIWRVENIHMPALDRQEGVETNWYFPKTVTIFTEDGKKVECRTYQQTINPPPRRDDQDIPIDRRPSMTYMECILKGAKECGLPKEYIKKLERIPHNGQEAPNMKKLLE